jgi:hypothetical protein
VSESRLVFFYAKGTGRDSFVENKFSRKVLANNDARKRQNFKAREKEEEDEEIQQQQRQNFPRIPFVWRKLLSLSLNKMQTLSAEDAFESLTIEPAPLLWKVLTDVQYRDIFETHILTKLNELSFRVFREVNTESRDAIRRSKRKLEETFKVYLWSRNPPEATAETRKIEGKEAQYHFCSEAARSGNLALLRWLREEKKYDWNDRTITAAAYSGNLHIVKYCMEHKCPIKNLACANAAHNGHLDILKYLRENGAPWDSWTCFCARENNQLECLNYAKENGCPDTLKP